MGLSIEEFIIKQLPFDTKRKIGLLMSFCNSRKIWIAPPLETIIMDSVPLKLRPFVKNKINANNRWQEIRKKARMRKSSDEIKPNNNFSDLTRSQRGKRFKYLFVCDKCKRKHTEGFLYKDMKGKEYLLCNYCAERYDFVSIIFTPTGNKR